MLALHSCHRTKPFGIASHVRKSLALAALNHLLICFEAHHISAYSLNILKPKPADATQENSYSSLFDRNHLISLVGMEYSVASITLPKLDKYQAPREVADMPILDITFAPRPKKRIFIPFNCSKSVIGFLNQPDVSGP